MTHTHRHNCPKCGNMLEIKLPKGSITRLAALVILALVCSNIYALYLFKKSGAGRPDNAAKVVEPNPFDITSYAMAASSDSPCGLCFAETRALIQQKREEPVKLKTRDMALIPAGEYQIGSPEGVGDPDERPRHAVQLDAFYMDQREVTNFQYAKFSSENPAHLPEWAKPNGAYNLETGKNPYYKKMGDALTAPDHPVVGISWQSADAYCSWMGKRLPTEAEWEAAARAESAGLFSFGDSVPLLDKYAWFDGNSGGRTNAVGTREPSKYKIYDMEGNVWEWVADRYQPDYYMQSPRRNPRGPEDVDFNERVIRGGSWAFDAEALRVANRASTLKANDDIGFRCAVSRSDLLSRVEEF